MWAVAPVSIGFGSLNSVEEAGFSGPKMISIERPGWLLENFEEHWLARNRSGCVGDEYSPHGDRAG